MASQKICEPVTVTEADVQAVTREELDACADRADATFGIGPDGELFYNLNSPEDDADDPPEASSEPDDDKDGPRPRKSRSR